MRTARQATATQRDGNRNAQNRLDAYRLAPLLRADAEMHGERRQQLLDGIWLRQKGRVLDKTCLHAVGQTAFGGVKHFQIGLSSGRFVSEFDAGGNFALEI